MAIVVELFYSGAWQDISQYVDDRAPISITRGRHDEGTSVDPSSCTLTLNNRDGRFSPRNPTSPLYGLIGRNTPIRVTKDSSVRFSGEVSAWPQQWEVAGKDVWVELQAAGILRRLGQGQPSGRSSALRNFLLGYTAVVYWPLDDGVSAPAGQPAANSSLPRLCAYGTGGGGTVQPGAGDLGAFLPPGLNIVRTGIGTGVGNFLNLGTSTQNVYDFVYRAQTLGPFTLSCQEMYDGATGVQQTWIVELRADGANDDVLVQLAVYDPGTGVTTTTTEGTSAASLPAVTDGNLHYVRFTVTENGADVDWVVYIDGVSVASGTHNSISVRGVYSILATYAPAAGDTAVAIGHLAIYVDGNQPALADVAHVVNGLIGETAGRRIERLCAENGVAFTSTGDLDDTITMGAQPSGMGFVTLVQECAATDLGILYEPRGQLGLAYRTRKSLYNQAAAVNPLDYAAKMLATPPDVTDDDQQMHNDVTVSNAGGGTAEAVLQSGPLSVQAPPNGINTYATSVSVNTQTDGPLDDIAAWLLHLGTVDEARYPQLSIDMINPAVAGILTALQALDVTSRVRVTNLPAAWLPPDAVSLLVQGYGETITQFAWGIVFNCVPESLYHVAVYGSAVGSGPDRFDAENSTLAASATATATSLSVASAAGTQLWTTVAGEFPFDIVIAGEEIQVSNITGSSSPQTMTVTRSINGVVKAHSAGEQVRLYKTPRFGL
jgi:hypothetical protein